MSSKFLAGCIHLRLEVAEERTGSGLVMSEQGKEKAVPDDRKRGRVKWYNDRRGYGFIEVDDHEVFIHRSTLQQFGIIRIQNEDIVLVTQLKTDRGYIVKDLYGIERPPPPDWLYATTPDQDESRAEVKFFNEEKGYGFIMVEGFAKDIFIHSRTLEHNRMTSLESGQKVLVKVTQSEEGPAIDTIRYFVGAEADQFGSLPQDQQPDDEDYPFDHDDQLHSSTASEKAFYDLTDEKS